MANGLTPYTSHVNYDIDPELQDFISYSAPCLDLFLSKRKQYSGRAYVVNAIGTATTVETYDPTGVAAISNTVQTSTVEAPYFTLDGHYVVGYGLTESDYEIGGSSQAIIKTEMEKRKTAKVSLMETVADDIYDGAGSSDACRGIDYMISRTNTDAWGTATAADFSTWDSQASSTSTVLNQFADINSQVVACTILGSAPDVAFCENAKFARLLDLAGQANILTNSTGTAKLGNTGIVYAGVEFKPDTHCTANKMYILNSRDLGLLVTKVFEDTGLKPISNAYRHTIGRIDFNFNPFCKNRRLHGGFTTITTS